MCGGDYMIWNKARECMSRDELAVLQGKRLVELVRYVYDKAVSYTHLTLPTKLEV